jgi:peptide deformylase
MSVLPIYLYGSPVLRAKAKPVADLDDSMVKLIYDMFETMRKANGVGLAANQVGDLRRVLVVDLSGVDEEGDEPSAPVEADRTGEREKTFVVINPEVLETSGSWSMEEGCLSIPDVRSEVERPERIRLRYRDGNFRLREMEAEGLLARVILHEIDHLDGVLFIDRISAPSRALLKGKLRSIKKGDVEAEYPIVLSTEV